MSTVLAQSIWCPGCYSTVYELRQSACPYCHRCPFCGRYLDENATGCECAGIDDPESVARLLNGYGVREANLKREQVRAVIRRELRTAKGIASGVVAGFAFVVSITLREFLKLWLVYHVLLMAVATCIMLVILSVVFRSIEEHRLKAMFP